MTRFNFKIILIVVFNIFTILAITFSLNSYLKKNMRSLFFQPTEIIFKQVNAVEDYKDINLNDYIIEKDTHKSIKQTDLNANEFCGEERIEYLPDMKNPIIVLGCSYAYGHGLKKEQSFPYLISKLTHRPVYNFAECGGEALSSLNNLYIYKEKNPENIDKIKKADYYIYIYMNDHIIRYVQPYTLTNHYNDLFKQNFFIHKLIQITLFRYILAGIQSNRILQGYPYETDKSISLLKDIILYTNNQIKKISPNAKFIIIIYDEKISDKYPKERIKYVSDAMNNSVWNEIEKEGITVVHSRELTGFYFDKNYKLKEDISDWHPNEKAWKTLTPLFVKKYIK